jgi:hypothetical protein
MVSHICFLILQFLAQLKLIFSQAWPPGKKVLGGSALPK